MSLETKELQRQSMTVDQIRQKAERFAAFDHQPIRYAPLAVISTARSYLERTANFQMTADYIIDAFEFFRGCVCWGDARIGVPLILVNEAFEWLEPADFDWEDLELVHFQAVRAGTGFEDFGLDKSEPFIVPDFGKIGFCDSMSWQEDSAKKLLKPLRNLRDGQFESSLIVCYKLERILAQLEEVSSDGFVSRYLGYRPRFG